MTWRKSHISKTKSGQSKKQWTQDEIDALLEKIEPWSPETAYGNCEECSISLMNDFKRQGIPAQVYRFVAFRPCLGKDAAEGHVEYAKECRKSKSPFLPSHYAVKIGDRILDPTLSQFGTEYSRNPPVWAYKEYRKMWDEASRWE